MILRVRSSLIQNRNGLPIQRHKLALEPKVANARNVLLPITPIMLEEQRDGRRRVPVCAVQGDFEDVRVGTCQGLWNGEFLRRGEVCCGREVEVWSVAEELDGFRGGGTRGGEDEEGVQFDLACETVICLVTMYSFLSAW